MSDFHIVDVFAERRYEGNPLAVVVDGAPRSGEEMLAITREFDFSETTFVMGSRDGAYETRIFTPAAEIPFAGHPTLGTAAVLRALHGGDRIALELGVGRVEVDFEAGGDGDIAWMHPAAPELGAVRRGALAADLLGLEASDLSVDYPVQEVSVGIRFLMVPVVGLAALRRVRLDLAVRDRLIDEGVELTGVYVFCREAYTTGRHVACRMLFDANGVREDPATGSACVCLGGYALEHGYLGGDSIEAEIEQGHEMGRPSLLRLRATEQGEERRISVGGGSIAVAEGRFAP